MYTTSNFVVDGAAKVNLDGIIETFATWDYPENLRKGLFVIYSKLAQYLIDDGDFSSGDKEITNAMFLIKTLIENCDELGNLKDRKLRVVIDPHSEI